MEAQLVIEPHTFSIRLYGPREAYRAPPKKPPQYGQWPNHNQQPQYQQPPLQYNAPVPYPKPATPQQRPNPPKAQPKPAPATTTPAPDPVIHMLAARAGTDPELKAVMKIVAAGQASPEQLAFFQGHITELTNILEKQKMERARVPPPPPPQPPVAAPTPPPRAPQPVPQPHQSSQHQSPHNTPKPYPPASNLTPQQHVNYPPPPTPHNNQYNRHNNQYYNQSSQQANNYAPVAQPPRTSYRPLVFDFVEGNGDKFYLPSYSFAEWLPNNQGMKISFLMTKMKPKPKEERKAVAPATPAPKASSTPTPTLNPTANLISNTPVVTNSPLNPTNAANTPAQTPAPATAPQYVPPPRIEDFDEKKDIKDIDFYQPVTVVILSQNLEISQSLPRAVRPPDVVERYMDEVFDTCKRADETYLAFRLPKEGAPDAEPTDRRTSNAMDVTPAVATPMADVIMGGMGASVDRKKSVGRPRKSLVA